MLFGGPGAWLKQIAQRRAGAEQPGPDSVQPKLEEIRDFGVAQLLEFAEHDDFAVERIQFFHGAANPKARFGRIPFRKIPNRVAMTKKGGAKGGLAAVGAKNLEVNGVKIGAKEGARLIVISGAKQCEERFLGEFFRVGRICNAPTKEAVKGVVCSDETAP